MRRGRLLLALLLSFAPSLAEAQQRPHLDPVLRGLMRPGAREEVERALDRAPAGRQRVPGQDPRGRRSDDRPADRFAGLALDRGRPGGGPRVGVLVRLREPVPASLAALRRAGAEVGSVVGNIATARVPLESLPRLAGTAAVERLDAARTLSLMNDSSMRVIRADQVRRRDGDLWYGSAGHGVIVGIFDTGADYRHEDFRDGEGHSRILGLWDLAQSTNPPPGFTEGYYCDAASLTDLSCPSRDVYGHGSHVLGTAAGDGSAAGSGTAYRYAGVAPAAGLLVVKGAGFTEDEIIDGVNWIFQTAEALGRPAVVNLSLGLQWGARDGSSLLEQALDTLSGPGRIVVVAAGNDASNNNASPSPGEAYFHAEAVPGPDSYADFAIEVPSIEPYGIHDFGLIELWYDGLDRYDVSVTSPSGRVVDAPYGQHVTDDGPEGVLVDIDNASDGADPDNGDHHVVLCIGDCPYDGRASESPESGTWTVRATPREAGSGRPIHLWISQSRYGGSGVLRGTSANFDNGYIISVPGTAKEVVTVGAFVPRTEWTSIYGEEQWFYREPVGDIAFYSNGGPTRDGRLKPEIAAPGTTIISTLSSSTTGVPSRFIAPDGVHAVNAGTSMATPHVTGAIAAMLQHEPTLTPAEVKTVLARTALQDVFTGQSYTGEEPGSPNNQWGHGKLDVRAAIEELVDPALIAGVLVVPGADSLPPGRTLRLWAQPYNALGDTVGETVAWSSSDAAVATVDATGLVTAHSLGATVITAAAGDRSGSATVTVITPSTLIVAAEAVPSSTPPSTEKGTRFVLMRLRLHVEGPEAVRVRRIGFTLTGDDPLATAQLVDDLDADTTIGEGDPVLAGMAAPLVRGEETSVVFQPSTLIVGTEDTASVLLALELGGGTPNGTSFQARYEPSGLSTVGVSSGEADRLDQPEGPVASDAVRATVLLPGEVFAMSENPVLSDRVIFNFRERPAVAAVFTLNGSRVVDLLPRLDGDGRVEWDLTNERGSAVAPGIYLVVFQVAGRLVTEKLIVVRRTDEEE